nr:hypothetical protein [Tanacetum cinerariifolium]
ADDQERKEESKVEDIETQNLELVHRVTKLTAKNNHLKQTYKQLFDSIKSSRVQSKEQSATLRELVESERLHSPLNTPLAYACKYTRRIQELLILQQTCPRITNLGTTLVAVTPKNQNKQVRRTPQITKSKKPFVDTSTSPNIDSNTPVLSSTRVALVSSASASQSKDNTKKNRIR